MVREVNLSSSALVMLDVQEDFLEARGGLKQVGLEPIGKEQRGVLISNCQRLAEEARSAGKPVVYVQTAFRSDFADCFLPLEWRKHLDPSSPVLVEGSPGASIPKEVAPREGDFVVTKKSLPAFQFTHLDRLLTSLGVDTCVLCGFCGVAGSIDDTARMGGLFGYDTVIPGDAVFPIHSPHLETLRKRAAVRETEEIIALMKAAAPKKKEEIRPALILVALNNDGNHPLGSKYKYGISGYESVSQEERENFIRNNNRLIDAMTQKGFPVIHAQTAIRFDQADDAHSTQAGRVLAPEWTRKFPPGVGYMIEGTWGAEILEGVRLPEGYYRVYKKGNSAFGLTHMNRLLRNLGVNLCIITGDSTTGCISDTVREGAGLAYELVLVSDATSRANIPYHQVLANRVKVRTTDEVLSLLEELLPATRVA
ncbi:MAG: isochorismatase family protein [Candidatus Binatia bacterium]